MTTPTVEAFEVAVPPWLPVLFRSTHIFSLDVCLVPSPCPGSLAFLCWLFRQVAKIGFRSRASVDGDRQLVCSFSFSFPAATAALLCLHSVACKTYVCRVAVSLLRFCFSVLSESTYQGSDLPREHLFSSGFLPSSMLGLSLLWV